MIPSRISRCIGHQSSMSCATTYRSICIALSSRRGDPKILPKMNEDAIIKLLKVNAIHYDSEYKLSFTSTDVIWFLDKNDHKLRGERDFNTFTYMVAGALEKSTLVEKRKDKIIALFMTDGNYPNYSFYGVYRLNQVHVEFSDNVGIEAHVPLSFKRVQDYYENE